MPYLDQHAAAEARALRSRQNGAKSKGPITPEGKAISSRNALKHGFNSSKHTLLPTDDPEEFEALRASFHEQLEPRNAIENYLVEKVVANAWRVRRIHGIESSVLEYDPKAGQKPSLPFQYNFHKLLTLAQYESHTERSIYKALHTLAVMRDAYKTQQILPIGDDAEK